MLGTSTPSRVDTEFCALEAGRCSAFFLLILEVTEEREDEIDDRADELNPIEEIVHSRHLLPSREESRHIELPAHAI